MTGGAGLQAMKASAPGPRGMRALALTLLVASLVAGCAAPQAEPSASAAIAVDVVMDPADCRLARAALVTPPAEVAPFLPEGFAPRDARAYLGDAAGTGGALVIVGAISCATAAHDEEGLHIGELAIFVEPPSVPGEREPSIEDFYVPMLYTHGRLLELARNASWDVSEAQVVASVSPTGPGASAQGGWTDQDGVTVAFGAVGAVTAFHEGLERYWHASEAGLAYVEAATAIDQRAGAASCTIPEGSLAADVTGVTSCLPGRSFGLATVQGEWTYRFVSLPGVRVA